MGIITRIGIASAAATLITGLAVGSASASQTGHVTNTTAISNSQEVHGLLAHNAGAIQVSADTVRLPDGSTITAFTSADGVTPASASGRCPGGHLCLFANSSWGGDQWTSSATSCGAVNLFNYFMGNGNSWADQASSIDNPAPRPGGNASFYHNNTFMLSLQAGHYLKNLVNDSSATGGNANDKIESLFPC
ncbi:MAG TPA: hypothetical protein VGD71_16140 [Kribbella sp.]|jgi:hypothetical protein